MPIFDRPETVMEPNLRRSLLMVSYTLGFMVSGGTTAENKNKALNWQMFWKIVGVDKNKGCAIDPNKIQFVIVNEALLTKPGYTPHLEDWQVDLAFDIANENRPLLPVMDHEDEEYEITE